jgi:hypothetical protein
MTWIASLDSPYVRPTSLEKEHEAIAWEMHVNAGTIPFQAPEEVVKRVTAI